MIDAAKRAVRARAVLEVDAHNAPPDERRRAITELFQLASEAAAQGYIAEAQSRGYEAMERLKAHKFMALNVEGGRQNAP
jgi:hypothetical protein